MKASRHFVLAAGGTGGHMIPAYALGAELVARGHRVALVTDARGAKIPGLFDAANVHVMPAGRISGGPVGWLKAAIAIWRGRRMAMRLYDRFEPSAVIGFGGYPALPALLGARARGIPSLVHEQNAVLGRVNRLLSRGVDAIAIAFPDVERISKKARDKVHLVGNPVREEVLALREQGFPAYDDQVPFRVLVTGGSQGATVLSEVVPAGFALLPDDLRARLHVTQQCRAEDIEAVRAAYAEHGIEAELETYMEDLPRRLGASHLVIARSGASTLAELTVAGRPAILVPLPQATDDHQAANTTELVAAGGARMIRQKDFTPQALARQVEQIALTPGALAEAARCSATCARPDATRDLADLVEDNGAAPLMDVIRVGAGGSKRAAGAAAGLSAREAKRTGRRDASAKGIAA